MEYDVAIIGAGPAGYVSAIRAGQMGMKTALIEAGKLGGMCLNWGCIPTKALLESAKRYNYAKKLSSFGIDGIDKKKLSFNYGKAVKRAQSIVRRLTGGIDFLLKKNGVELILGEATIEGEHAVSVGKNRLLETEYIVIATGSRPKALNSSLPEGAVTEIDQLIQLTQVPDNVVVYGQGPHAVELAQLFALIDRTITLLVPNNELLFGLDNHIVNFISKKFKKEKIEIIYDAKVEASKSREITVQNRKIPCELLINGSIREGVIPQSDISLELEENFVKVNEHFQTSVPNIFAIGDVNGKSYLAHAASAEGLQVINFIKGMSEEFDITRIPINLYTIPEIAQLGLTESEVKERGIEYKISEFPLSANGKAMIEDQAEGSIRMISEKKYGEVLGVQIIAPNATDMIAEAATLMNLEGTIYDVAKVIHAHPTVSEVFMEAGFDAMDQAIHK